MVLQNSSQLRHQAVPSSSLSSPSLVLPRGHEHGDFFLRAQHTEAALKILEAAKIQINTFTTLAGCIRQLSFWPKEHLAAEADFADKISPVIYFLTHQMLLHRSAAPFDLSVPNCFQNRSSRGLAAALGAGYPPCSFTSIELLY